MDELLHQLGGLFLGTVPTMVLFLLVVVSYRFLVYGPLTRILDERRARTEGAIEEAQQSIAAAGQKADEYETRLREARKAVFEAREQRLRRWSDEREAALAAARESAQKRIADAKVSVDQEVGAARRTIETSAEDLAKEVLRAVLPPAGSASDLALSGSSR